MSLRDGLLLARAGIARGVPMGGDLEFTDEVTLGRALQNRMPI